MCIPSSDDRMLMGGGLDEMSPYGVTVPCRLKPTVTVCCTLEGKLRATGSPFDTGGTYRWFISGGAGVLSDTSGAEIVLERASQQPTRVGVEYSIDGISSQPAYISLALPPTVLHFVWAGGAKILPAGNMAVIKEWLNRSPSFSAWIWVDAVDDPECAGKYRKAYGEELATLPIMLKDITQERVVTPYIRYEIDKLWPNYGASSDLLRYRILHKFGGAYFDSDVHPGNAPISMCGASSRLMMYDNSQGAGRVGNDAFVCVPGSSVMEQFYTQAVEHYYRITGLSFEFNNARYYEDYTYRRESTIRRTGPTMVRKVLIAQGLLAHDGSKLPAGYNLPAGIIAPPSGDDTNTEGWLKVPIKRRDYRDAVEAAAASMKFEIENMGMFRVVDHVAQIAQSAGIVLTTFTPLQDYSIVVNTIDTDQAATGAENGIAQDLEACLRHLGVDISKAIQGVGLSPHYKESPCRYAVFETLHGRIV